PPAAIRDFCERIGVAKRDSMVDVGLLEHSLRENLNENAPRAMAVLRPLKVVIVNYPEGQTEELTAANHPDKPEMGSRKVGFSRELYIEREDFREEPPKKFFRLAPGREVRLRYAYLVTCQEVVKDANGEIVEVRCTYDPATRGGSAPDGRKVKGTIHWVSAAHGVAAEVRLYDRLFTVENPAAAKDTDFLDLLNPDSLTILPGCRVEPALARASAEKRFQFERQGYFCPDLDSTPERPVFNRIVTLRDSWAKVRGE
ncbi:MAG: glutamine--tRNA ligase, partial [Desulfobacteraceae bacterium]|nr:glutamine--tRNA ligase [Desulfobacteraceae bacterium]